MKTTKRRIGGLIAPVLNASHPDGSLNLDIIPKYAEILVKNEVTGVFVCGTAGEGTSLTMSERMLVLEAWCSCSRGRFQVISHIGTNCLEDAKELARHAEKVGASAIGLVSPHYIKPDSVEVLVKYCAEVAKAAPSLPFFYYHYPGITNVHFTALSFLEHAADVIPTLQGIKFTHNDYQDFGLCVDFRGGKYDILNGFEQVLLAGLAFGCKGSIGITFSLIGNHYSKVCRLWGEGKIEQARKEHQRAVVFYSILQKYNLIKSIKVLLRHTGLGLFFSFVIILQILFHKTLKYKYRSRTVQTTIIRFVCRF
eukprot:TRINITY_DN2329_c0_g1_i1.p1 TRINITY_DN2329_c0_g1~~TRINITY_DN2329_c0_g1_i1.p1  ORF type:complete len:322 (+),score=28.06 TRINITY_DN2329_c0_g1_i1:38-967(+)